MLRLTVNWDFPCFLAEHASIASMASDLEEVWQRLTLTKEEDEVIDVDDVDSAEKSEQIELCLCGKLLISKPES